MGKENKGCRLVNAWPERRMERQTHGIMSRDVVNGEALELPVADETERVTGGGQANKFMALWGIMSSDVDNGKGLELPAEDETERGCTRRQRGAGL